MREAGAAGGAGDDRWRRIEEKREKRGEERGEMRLTCETQPHGRHISKTTLQNCRRANSGRF
jgi:hypothetical protein